MLPKYPCLLCSYPSTLLGIIGFKIRPTVTTLLKTDKYFCCILLTSFIFLHTWHLSRDERLPVNMYERMCHRLCVHHVWKKHIYNLLYIAESGLSFPWVYNPWHDYVRISLIYHLTILWYQVILNFLYFSLSYFPLSTPGCELFLRTSLLRRQSYCPLCRSCPFSVLSECNT